MAVNQAAGATVQEYSIRVPKNGTKAYHVMRFNSVLNIEFSKWTGVKMERENNLKEFRGLDDDMPKFGAGSEFGRDMREEARRKKYGIITKGYRPEDQPWILKVGGKTGKKFKGSREGGVAENAAYYVFTHAPDGAIDAYPLQEWYNFQPIQRYKTLSAEEAEQEFGRRNKVMNYFTLMTRKRFRNEEDLDLDEGEEGKGKGKSKKAGAKSGKAELKISEMDEWMDTDDDSDSEEEGEKKEEEEEKEDKDKKKKGKNTADVKKKKKKKKGSDDEAFEESDDGDEEGREVDYISDSSDSELDEKMQGVAEEDALRKLLTSDEDEEEEEDKDKKKEESEGDENKEDSPNKDKEDKKKEKKSKKLKKKMKKSKKEESPSVLHDSSSDLSSDSTDSENESKKKRDSKGKESNSGNSSRATTPTKDNPDGKRKLSPDASITSAAKRARLENFATASSSGLTLSSGGDTGITEDAVRRYLMRKPMTTTELLQKFKSKKTGLTSDQLVNVMTQILKKINPLRQTIKGKMYLSLKA